METDLPYLGRENDRHGNVRIYVRRNGKRVRIREREGTPAFAKAYSDAVERLGEPPSKRPQGPGLPEHPKGSLGWLGAQYFVSKGQVRLFQLSRGTASRDVGQTK